MRKILLSLLFFPILPTIAQPNGAITETDSTVKFVQLPDSTAIGSPAGKKLSKEIGIAGGTIVSEDGRLELIFPAGAVTQNTEISIQPITTVIPHANKSYQFEPSGTQFNKPVQLIYRYTDEEAGICPPQLKFMALQDDKGKWEYAAYDEWDSAGKSLKGTITHFSAFVDGNEIELNNTEITLKVGQTHNFHLSVISLPDIPTAPGEDEIPSLPVQRGNRETQWKVNERLGGSSKHGTISSRRSTTINGIYKAPAVLTSDKVTVKLELNDISVRSVIGRGRRGRLTTVITRRINVATFTCNVKLYDEYRVIVSQHVKVDGGEMSDSSSFRLKVSMEDRVSISEISNQLARVRIDQNSCRAIYVNHATCVGPINVAGIRTSNVMASADGLVGVYVYFTPAPFVFPVIHFPPCGHNRASNTTMPVNLPYAFPMYLNFKAKDQKQYISLGAGTEVSRPDPDDIIATIVPIR